MDDLALPDHIDPSRWPFCEARARAATALSSYPEPVVSVESAWRERQRCALAFREGRQIDGGAVLRKRWEARRRAQRLGEVS